MGYSVNNNGKKKQSWANWGLGDWILSTKMKSLFSLVDEVLLPTANVETTVTNSSGISAKIGVISQQEMDLLYQK